MERIARLISTYSRRKGVSLDLLDCGSRYLGARTFSGHASSLREVDTTRLSLCKRMSVSSWSVFGVQRSFSPMCTSCTVKMQGSARISSFDSLSQQSAKRRGFSVSSVLRKGLAPDEVKKRVDDLTDRFAEARELLGDARESLGSTYFSEDMLEAQEAVSETLAAYEALLADLDEDQRNDVVRTIGLRMEELTSGTGYQGSFGLV